MFVYFLICDLFTYCFQNGLATVVGSLIPSLKFCVENAAIIPEPILNPARE